jgi:hypothetical protein
MRLVRSSIPGAVERDTALRLLAERAVLTRTVCCELRDADLQHADRRSQTALSLLLIWIQENLPESVRVEPRPEDGLDQMIIPDGCQAVLREIRAGAHVGEALFMFLTADTSVQADQDRALIRERLTAYWREHPVQIAVAWA